MPLTSERIIRFGKAGSRVLWTSITEQRAILADINLTIPHGSFIALAGESGCGKSTIAALLSGKHKNYTGRILFGADELKTIDEHHIMRHITVVKHNAYLFKGTVRENIVQKAPYVDDIQIIKAAKVSGVDEYVNAHPLGFDMPVFERGDGISGGQRQSIAVARAFLLDSPIILLDEPTNSLDNTVENKLKINLKTNTANKTMLLVTHRTSMLDLVDRLIVMDNGKILLDGPRDEVLARLSGK